MFDRNLRSVLLAAVLIAGITLAGCGSTAPAPAAATQAPAPTAEPPTATPIPPTATPIPPTPTPEPPTATPKPALPDAKADPKAALLYSSTNSFQSATYTYSMTMTMQPADDASTKALGAAASMLAAANMQATGKGAMQVVDAAAGKTNFTMDMQLKMMGQEVPMEMVMVGDTAWVRTNNGAWQKTDTSSAAQARSAGSGPQDMLAAFKDAADVQWLEDTQLNGEPVRHMKFTVDPSKGGMSSFAQGLVGGSAGQMSAVDAQAMMKDMTVEGEAWLAAKDLQPRQEKMTLVFNMPLAASAGIDARLRTSIDMLMKFDNINQPVKIEPPAPGS